MRPRKAGMANSWLVSPVFADGSTGRTASVPPASAANAGCGNVRVARGSITGAEVSNLPPPRMVFRFRYRKSKHCHGCICFSERASTFSALPARVVFSDSVVHLACGLQSTSLRLQGFLLATLVDIRSSKAPHCLIRRWNRRQSITLWSRAF